jgi:hypothetical protein
MVIATDLQNVLKSITCDPRHKFHEHIMNVVNASCRRLGFIMGHSRQFPNPMSSRLLYNALVRSNLDYIHVILSVNKTYLYPQIVTLLGHARTSE